jgi:hypothetical protein
MVQTTSSLMARIALQSASNGQVANNNGDSNIDQDSTNLTAINTSGNAAATESQTGSQMAINNSNGTISQDILNNETVAAAATAGKLAEENANSNSLSTIGQEAHSASSIGRTDVLQSGGQSANMIILRIVSQMSKGIIND